MNWKQFELGVLRRQLKKLETAFNMGCPSNVIKLVGETIFHESGGLTFIGQVPNDDDPDGFGPGLGMPSIERPTWDWMKSTNKGRAVLDGWEHEDLIGNLNLCVWACRLRYWLVTAPVPKLSEGVAARAEYWRVYYNAASIDYSKLYIAHASAIPWVIKDV